MPGVKSELERSFKADLSAVRVHTDGGAREVAVTLSARAVTHGTHVFLGPGENENDLPLMAHEVAHVVQQRGGAAPQAWSESGGDRFEHEAQRASDAVGRGESFTVRERTDRPRVQRFGISNILDKLAGMANGIPGFRMFTIVLGVNPINMSAVPRTAANILRAAVEIIPGGALITAALDGYGIFDKIGAWVEQQINSLGMVGSAIRAGLMKFLDSIELTDLVPWNLGKLADKALDTLTAPVKQVWNFVVGLAGDILTFIKDALLVPVAKLAQGTRGYDLLKAILGKDPITGDAVPRTAETLIPGFLKLIGEEETWQNMQKSNAIPRAWAWFQGAVDSVLGFVREFPALVVSTIKSLTLSDVFPPTGVLAKVGSAFGDFIGRFISWIGTALWNLLEIIFQVVSPGAWTYIQKTGAALKSILKNPLPFVGNLIKAAKGGFDAFAGNFGGHLKAGLISWLTGALEGVYIPKSFDLQELVKFVLSVLGLTWGQIRPKLVKATNETIVTAMETGFDLVVTLVTKGPGAFWEQLKSNLATLRDQVIGGITDLIVNLIVTKAIPKIIAMFIPGAGFIGLIMSIYDTVMTFVNRLKQIIAAVTAFIDSIVAIAAGNIGAAVSKVESVLAKLLSLAIAFLFGFAGLGKVADKVMGVIKKIRAPIDKALDALIAWVVNMAKKLFAKVFGRPDDKRTDAEKQADLNKAIAEAEALQSQPEATDPEVRNGLKAIKSKYKMTALDLVVDTSDKTAGTETVHVAGEINPKKSGKGSKIGFATGQLTISSLRVKDPDKASKVEIARATSGRAWQDAINSVVIKEILVPRWEIAIRVPIEILVRGQKAFAYPSRSDLARLKIERGHRAGRAGVEPDVTMEVREPSKPGLKEVRLVEVTLVEDFTAKGDFAEHKIQQFTSDVMIMREKYDPGLPVKYTFIAPRPPTPATKAFILGTLKSQGATNFTVVWLVVKT
jgi:hypothetical protein